MALAAMTISPAQAQDPIRIGFVMAKQGAQAEHGKHHYEGKTIALKKFNNTVRDQPVEVIWLDEPTPQDAQENMQTLIDEQKVVAVVGGEQRHGPGTTLKALMSAIEVSLGDKDITGLPSYEINRLGISMVPEVRRLFLGLTVLENLQLAQREGGGSIEEIYELFPKLNILRNQKVQGLSGGERQMVGVARALMVPSKVILLDEPFEGLAPQSSRIFAPQFPNSARASLIIVEHHAQSVLPISDRAYAMVNGQVAYQGTAYDLAMDAATQTRILGVAGEH
ncbi:ABC-type branched-subunit amino acid transport system ATPase component [Sinorhizobium terangae]|uniref:ATP-binding cassette domain-containing protein n=1 Tax=Sinorhizobium terangae TaxID=110322 RepID=UPI00142F0737|nr:ATP-binding cassette domain-containing protein [Sinorhizobium terangae]MBB4188534.1 ABC-type branched-subunit amino acid transport system ATPase component [Sinorhizobium terangae]